MRGTDNQIPCELNILSEHKQGDPMKSENGTKAKEIDRGSRMKRGKYKRLVFLRDSTEPG